MRVIFLCNTPYQVMTACCVKHSFFKEAQADIIISDHMQLSQDLAAHVNDAKGLFENVFNVASKQLFETVGKANKYQRRFYRAYPEKIVDNLIKVKEKYDVFLCANVEPFSELFFLYLRVLTLLNQIFYKILAGNSDSKVLLLTHDLWTMQSLDSNFKAINNSLTSKTFINLCHLKKQSLANNNVKSLNRYKMYLFNVYKFASTQSKQSELYTDIGNEIRKVLEAYFTFNFANGIDYLSQQEIFKENLTLADYAEYFQGRVLKLFFHDDSHMENTIKYLTDGRFYDEDEIKRAAQDVLVFLFLHNKQHIFNYLATSQKNAILEDCYQVNEHELEDNLNKWKSNIDMELGL